MEAVMETQFAKNTPLDMNKWGEIIANWSKSGESQKAYCERLGINLNTFTYVRSKLQKKEKPSIQFAPVIIKNNEECSSSNQPSIILENNKGYKLHFPVSLSLEQLAKLFKLSGWCDA
jgi:hypothetical protein